MHINQYLFLVQWKKKLNKLNNSDLQVSLEYNLAQMHESC